MDRTRRTRAAGAALVSIFLVVAAVIGVNAVTAPASAPVLVNQETPEATETAEPTETPEATEAPEATETAEPTETPEATEAPEATETPEVEDDQGENEDAQ